MFGAILAYLATPLGKIIGIIGAVLVAAFLIFMTVKIHDAGVRRQALAEYNKSQLEQALEEQRQTIQKMVELQELNRKIIEELNRQREENDAKMRAIEEYLTSEDAKRADKPASELLRETVRRLREGSKK